MQLSGMHKGVFIGQFHSQQKTRVRPNNKHNLKSNLSKRVSLSDKTLKTLYFYLVRRLRVYSYSYYSYSCSPRRIKSSIDKICTLKYTKDAHCKFREDKTRQLFSASCAVFKTKNVNKTIGNRTWAIIFLFSLINEKK